MIKGSRYLDGQRFEISRYKVEDILTNFIHGQGFETSRYRVQNISTNLYQIFKIF